MNMFIPGVFVGFCIAIPLGYVLGALVTYHNRKG